jgi:hypothetical protein
MVSMASIEQLSEGSDDLGDVIGIKSKKQHSFSLKGNKHFRQISTGGDTSIVTGMGDNSVEILFGAFSPSP